MSTEPKPIKIPGGHDLASILLFASEIQASDVHLTVGEPPCLRINGSIVAADMPPLDRDGLHMMLYDILDDDKRYLLEQNQELDFSFQMGSTSRFRANCFYTIKGEGAVFRIIPTAVRSFEELGLPGILKKVSTKPRGLVLVTGPTGSGKSTSLAAMIDYVNSTRDDHILTIEDPIEFVHTNKRCIVNQREVGSNTGSFAQALRSALREDPDIILVGELRDLETISLALTASETGHLVFGTMHTQSAAKTCDRLIDVFPPEQQKLVRIMFAETFEAIVCQSLVPKADGTGRLLAMEILLGIPSSRALIREGKTHQISTIIQTSQKHGMQSMDQCLKDMLMRRVISEYQALSRSNNPDMIMPNGSHRLEELIAQEASELAQNAGQPPAMPHRQPPPPPQVQPPPLPGNGSPIQSPPSPHPQAPPPQRRPGIAPPPPPPPKISPPQRAAVPPSGNNPAGPPAPPSMPRREQPKPKPPETPQGGSGDNKPKFPFGPKKR